MPTDFNLKSDLVVLAHQRKKEDAFWRATLSHGVELSCFPFDNIRHENTSCFKTFRTSLSHASGSLLWEFTRGEDIRLYVAVCAAVCYTISRITRQQTVSVGTPVLGNLKEDDVFNQMLVLMYDHQDNITGRDLLNKIRDVVREINEHATYPLSVLREELGHRIFEEEELKLFDISLTLENVQKRKPAEDTKVNFNIFFSRAEQDITVEVHYNSSLYSELAVENVVRRIDVFFNQVIGAPDMMLQHHSYMLAEEENAVVNTFNATDTGLPARGSFCDAFRDNVQRKPGQIALEQGALQLTFAELDKRSDAVMHDLRSRISGKAKICVLHRRNTDLLVWITGIIKSGHIYVPLNVEDPEERIQYILSDTEAGMLIADSYYLERKPGITPFCNGKGIPVNSHLPEVPLKAMPASPPLLSDVVYIIYTSGTTGKPKGVQITHGNLMNYLHWAEQAYITANATSIALHSNIAFDMSITSLFLPLTAGGKMVLYQEGENDFAVGAIVMDNKTDILKVTPSHLRLLIQLISRDQLAAIGPLRLKTLIVGGENLTCEIAQKIAELFGGKVDIYNEYGPTEATVGCMIHRVDLSSDYGLSVPIGKPVSNTGIYILDEQMRPQPVGFPGELYIGGSSVAPGYYHQTALTAARFLTDPFRNGGLLYKTGDLAVMSPQMNIHYLGRIDEQVKINGYRVEPDEIKRQLLGFEGIMEAQVVFQQEKDGAGTLACYYISAEAIEETALRDYCLKRLPVYMLPSFFIRIDAIPLTAGGKLDKASLPAYRASPEEPGRTPVSEEETRLLDIWRDILKKPDIQVTSDFYLSGGDSIKAIRMIATLNKTAGVKLTVSDLLTHPTVRQLLACMHRKKEDAGNDVIDRVKADFTRIADTVLQQIPSPDKVDDAFPLSDIQLGMIYHSRSADNLALYHDQMIHRLQYPDFNFPRFRQALLLMIEKHPILRTGFDLHTYAMPVQIVYKEITPALLYVDLSGEQEQDAGTRIQNFLAEDRRNPFDITSAPLWRLNIFSLRKDEIIMVWVVYHAIIDGWSDASFKTELHNIYLRLYEDNTYKPSLLKITYRDYVVQEYAGKGNANNRLFWEKELRGLKPLLLPADTGPATSVTSMKFRLPLVWGQGLDACAVQLDSDVRTLLMAACLQTMKILTHEREVTIGMVLNNRPETEDGDKVLGCFLNTLPVRYIMAPGDTYRDLVRQVTAKMKGVQLYKHSTLAEISGLPGNSLPDETPLFDIIFNYMDFHVYDSATGLDRYHREDAALEDWSVTNYKLTFNVSKVAGTYELELLYYSDFIASVQQTICSAWERVIGYFITDVGREIDFADLVERQEARTPDSVALISKGNTFSCGEVNRQANRLATVLHRNGLEKEAVVGVMADQSANMIIAVMGILKAGAAYLPLDPDTAATQLTAVLKNNGVKWIIGANILDDPAVSIGTDLVCRPLWDWIKEEPHTGLAVTWQPGDPVPEYPSVFITDANGQQLPMGITGEICIGSKGMYRTGCTGKKLANGAVELADQVNRQHYEKWVEEESLIVPRNEVEDLLAEIWAEVLQTDKGKIGINSSFFRLGGNSLTVMLMGDKVHLRFNIRISITEIFRNPTIQHIASFIRSRAVLATGEESGILI
ncbi:non-ribosomal peptide synthetase [Chitinophaga sp.]|uniref:non-ribosomal peptide synthetase n=1 Tax=Chitinophaga sp. TaxID=1869181 RepID=UPI002CCD87D6|nr:non-ribosomal peptide synthetase [Chitinophaga sp.]HWV64271.1 amino acid adenylation domain-containing protein [Chitinophaga sp.]